MASVYYFAAAIVFPDDLKEHPDLDAHYWAIKHRVIGLVLLCDVVVFLLIQLLGRSASAWVLGFNAVYFASVLGAFFARGRKANIILLSALVVLMATGFLMPS